MDRHELTQKGLETADYLKILKQYWGYNGFRSIQLDIIESIGNGRDTLGLMPTGGGKSITFQVPALAQEGTCIVITPLIALMKDQVQNLRKKSIKAAAVYTGMLRSEIIKTLENCIFGGIKILYISPERLSSPIFQTKLHHMKVSFITVDEAHCISQWGYDFRPAYLKIAEIRKLKPAPVLALTATATEKVVDDIQAQLAFQQKNVFRMSFERPNLAYVVRKTNDKIGELIHILSRINGSAIVYVRSRRRCKELSAILETNGIQSTFYHAGLEPSVRDERQKLWNDNKKRVIVATNAFGMGIDKPDVRVVIHMDSPDSIEAYFQEAGRAGRDGMKSFAVLLWNNGDPAKLQKRINSNFPPKEFISDVYEHLAYFYQIGVGSGEGHTFSFEIGRFCVTYSYSSIYVDSALRILQNAGYLRYETEPDASARVHILLQRNDLYRLNELTPKEEAVMTTLLRCYGGLFTSYEFIDETLVASLAGLSNHETYQTLKSLSMQHIIHFIPQRKTPYITFLHDRDESIYLSESIYDNRKTEYIKRIEAVIAYASNDYVCRSRQLLRYFGEKTTHDCGQCDVCLKSEHDDSAREKIMQLLKDNKWHQLKDVMKIDAESTDLDHALKYLVQEEIIHIDGDKISLKNNDEYR
ncbi:MAG: RecQ family ATP-dependent DNA helicase [Prevotellaceae bacterium]|nr:RecQ family ATP-dependent DNA helicase [Prevotellaceae bacterium]